MSERLVTIRTLSQLEELKAYIKDKDFIAYDTETVGAYYGAEIIGFSIAAEIDLAYYVILSYWDPVNQKLIELETKQAAKEVIKTLEGKSLIMQNAPFDCEKTLTNFGVDLMPHVHTDTMVAGHLLNENRLNGLKERGVELYGEDARKEQLIMKESVHANGGVLTKEKYELYKADPDLLAHYGAKDAILTLKLFYNDVPQLFEESLDKFFYEDETMQLLRGPTYDMNTTGLRVDPEKLQTLKQQLEADCLEAKGFIYKEIEPHVLFKYPGTSKAKTFNINAGQQLAWLCFEVLDNEFGTLTKGGKELCKALDMKVPYSYSAKIEFMREIKERNGQVWEEAKKNLKTGKMGRPKKIGNYWQYLSCGKETIQKLATKYKWAAKLLEYKKNEKILGTYVIGIQTKMKYGIIRPSFLQHGTTSGRYSSRTPNFQNLPRDDKRVKACIVARPGKVFVGADYNQLEPRCFASISGDETLQGCFSSGDDFYSVVGAPVFQKSTKSLKKDDKDGFAKLFPKLRDQAKVVALAAPYGKQAWSLARMMGISVENAQQIIDDYFMAYPKVHAMMLDSHKQAKEQGYTSSIFGRPRRMPEAKTIKKMYGNTKHEDLPYWARNLLNLAMNHRVQSTGASIVNRAAIAFYKRCKALQATNSAWGDVRLVLQVHDELVVEGPEALAEQISAELKVAMETTTTLPGVLLTAEPKIGYNLADLK